MTYCRWSTDDFQSDLYCYQGAEGLWTTCVSANRRARTKTDDPYSLEWMKKLQDKASHEEWYKLKASYEKEVESLNFTPIGLEHDGKVFKDASIEDFRVTLEMLCDTGYQVPDYLIPQIDDEIMGVKIVA